ncbi:HU family DNA-binding protein [Paracoccus denitrificans]|uniref:HU family DNA-binding protein n=1 Tax=Paracoccus denitrificans TaxID=266 RepID=UPI003364CF13
MANFSKSDLIAAVAQTTGHKKKDVEEMVFAVFATIREEAEAGQTVNITGFGRFAMKDTPAREGRNPRTGETVQIAAKRVLKFKPSKSAT